MMSQHPQSMSKALRQCAQRPLGFTLIELMITVAIVAILATIAFPSYQRAIAKSDRSIAISDINEISQALERYFTYNRVYSNDFGDLNMGSNNTFTFHDNPGQAKYDYTIGVPSTTTIGAVPQGGETGQSFVIYAKPATSGSRDTWTLSQDHQGTQQRYDKTSTVAQDGWHF